MQSFSVFFPLLAQDAPTQPGGLGGMLVPMVLIFSMMYFVMIRPQQKRQKELKAMLESLGVGDEVVTTGGIYGVIKAQTDRVVTLQVDDGVRLRFDRAAIAQVAKKKDAPAAELPSEPAK